MYHIQNDIIHLRSVLVKMDKKKTLERIKSLTELHGAPGFEEDVRNYMKKKWHHMLMNLL